MSSTPGQYPAAPIAEPSPPADTARGAPSRTSPVDTTPSHTALRDTTTPALPGLVQPRRLLITVATIVFLAEALIMLLLFQVEVPGESFFDAIALTIIVVPLLDRFMLRPLRTQMAERARAEASLAQSNQELRALGQLEHKQRRLAETMAEAAAALNSSLEPQDVLDGILEQAWRVVPCHALAILLLQEEWIDVTRFRQAEGPWQDIELGFPMDRFPLLRELARAPRTYVVSDMHAEADWATLNAPEWVHSLVLAPLLAEDETVGFLVVASEQVAYFDSDSVHLLITFAAYASMALHHARVHQLEQKARQAAETLAAGSLSLAQTLDMQTILDLLLAYVYRLVAYDRGSVALLKQDSELTVSARAHFGNDSRTPSILPPVLHVAEHSDLKLLLQQRRTAAGGFADAQYSGLATARDHFAAKPSWLADCNCTCSWLAVPLVAGERTLGICFLKRLGPNGFAPADVSLVEGMISQGAVALQNAWLFQEIREGREHLQALSYRLLKVQETERSYVARELHDEAGQALTSLLLRLHEVERDSNDAARVKAGVEEMRQIANGVQEELHRLAVNLRPASLDHLGLDAALQSLVDRLNGTHNIQMRFKATGDAALRLNREIENALYRIAQEALTNIIRHAHASHADILLHRTTASVMLTVEDDGVGFDPNLARASGRIGLIGMRERCEMVGGTLLVESASGAGATVVVEIPQ